MALPHVPPPASTSTSNRRSSVSSRRISATIVTASKAQAFSTEFEDATTNGATIVQTLPQSTARGASTSSTDSPLPPPPLLRSVSSSISPVAEDMIIDEEGTSAETTLSARAPPSPPRSASTNAAGASSTTLRPRRTSSLSRSYSPDPLFSNRQDDVGLGLTMDGTGVDSGASIGARTETTAVSRAREMMAKLGLEADGADGEWASFERPAAAAQSRDGRRETLPRLTTSSAGAGGAISPLLVYSGSPVGSPRSYSPSPLRAPSPSNHPSQPSQTGFAPHASYSMPLPLSNNNNNTLSASQLSARLSTSTSPSFPHTTPIPMSRPGSYQNAPSIPMDRTTTSSKSRDHHSRHQSLSSACAPVTSNYTPELLSSATPGASGSMSPYGQPSPKPRGWKAYDWGVSKDVPSSPSHQARPSDPRQGAKSYATSDPLSTFLSLPTTLLSFFLAPLSNAPSHHHSPALNASTAPTTKGKRYPLPIRLLTISYLVFSFVFFGAQMAGWSGSDAGTRGLKAIRLGPRADAVGEAGGYRLAKVAGAGAEWAQRVAEGVRWRKVEEPEEEEMEEEMQEGEWDTVKRIGSASAEARLPATNPLTPFTHTYRFAKMHDKLHWDMHDEIEPHLFRAIRTADPDDITACLYSNEAWLSTLPSFVHAWGGPVSLVFETSHSRFSPRRAALLDSIAALRKLDALVRELVDFHVVGTPDSTSFRTQSKTRERFIQKPIALNFHINLARFFAPTDVIFVVGDARTTPSVGLRRRLLGESIKDLVLARGDAVVVPSFGFIRDPSGDIANPKTPTIHDLRAKLDLPRAGQWDGVGEDEFELLAAENVLALHETLPLSPDQWPQKKSALVSLVNTRVGTPESPTPASLALFDARWDLNRGPTNWYLWRKASTDPRLVDKAERGGGLGLGVDGTIGGGTDVYRVVDYDLHYAPNVVMSKRGQPWCSERFEHLQAACTYQMYLSGADLWVLPDEWTFTVEVLEKSPEGTKIDPAEKLKTSISSRLYGKFHQEACMHYGREFLSIQMWDSEKAQNLRAMCVETLASWGMGL